MNGVWEPYGLVTKMKRKHAADNTGNHSICDRVQHGVIFHANEITTWLKKLHVFTPPGVGRVVEIETNINHSRAVVQLCKSLLRPFPSVNRPPVTRADADVWVTRRSQFQFLPSTFEFAREPNLPTHTHVPVEIRPTDLELWPGLDVESCLRSVSADDDGIVAGVAVVDVADRQSIVAICHADVVLGPVVQIESVLQPLRSGVRFRYFAFERCRFAETTDFDVLQWPRELNRFDCARMNNAALGAMQSIRIFGVVTNNTGREGLRISLAPYH
jgi:hypothetical protein